MPRNQKPEFVVLGLGYVGMRVASAFGERYPTTGYDIDEEKIAELQGTSDTVTFTSDTSGLSSADVYIIAVPTPIDKARDPDLSALLSATRTVGQSMTATEDRPSPLVIYESTVYPGCTIEECVPLLEEISGLRYDEDFEVGYSPERINPGDNDHTFTNITKVVAANNRRTAERVADLYGDILEASVHIAPNIETAEAAKIIENTQRDLNIALMNELSMLFRELDLETSEVLDAASTKWNFLDFHPGLVGGHCIPVDPYYLKYRADQAGFHAELVSAGRRINDLMPQNLAAETLKELASTGRDITSSKALLVGMTFKPDVSDMRRSGSVALAKELESFGIEVKCADPLLSPESLKEEGLTPTTLGDAPEGGYDLCVLAVDHQELPNTADAYLRLLSEDGLFVDIEGSFDLTFDGKGHTYLSL